MAEYIAGSCGLGRVFRRRPLIPRSISRLDADSHLDHEFGTADFPPSVLGATLIATWEAWAVGREDAPDRCEPISEGTEVWAASEPALAGVEPGVIHHRQLHISSLQAFGPKR